MRLLYGRPTLVVERVSSFAEYRSRCESMKEVFADRARNERNLIPADNVGNDFWVRGFCTVCQCWTRFQVDFQFAPRGQDRPMPNWRESLVCPGCRLNNRMRASFQIFQECLHPALGSSVYMTEQVTPLFAQVAAHYTATVGSEFLSDGTPVGSENALQVRNEDLTRLSFGDARFDYVLTFEVLEHVPDYTAALRECARILKPGGIMLVTVPFHGGERTTVRARVGPDGIEHLLPPESHGDPLESEGCLCYYHFGWDFIAKLKEAGFRDVSCLDVYSQPLGYLGGLLLFLAIR
jgi:hypothetical protein